MKNIKISEIILLFLLLSGAGSIVASSTVTNATAKDKNFNLIKFDAAGHEIKVYTYRPSGCIKPSLLFVFHGLKRNAKSIRKKAVKVAQEACLMVFSPLFDKDRFPNWRYHRAGVVRDGKVQPESRWTAPILRDLLLMAKKETGNPDAKIYLFGHSAGGQFLSRISAYSPPQDVHRIIIANPSAYVTPQIKEPAPYGFGGVFSSIETSKNLKRYLSLPITIYLGKEDTGDKYLNKNKAAMRQGLNRLDRGRNIFQLSKSIATRHGWPFNWQLVEAPGVGHSSRGMLGAPEFFRAIGLPAIPNKEQLPEAA